jgi:hypothetical protein
MAAAGASRRELPPGRGEGSRRLVRIPFEELVEGASYGPFHYSLTPRLCNHLRGPVGERRPGRLAPPAVFPVLILQAHADAFDGIPVGGLLTTEELEVLALVPVDGEVDARVSIERIRVGKGRPRVTFAYELSAPDGRPYATGTMEIAWASAEELEGVSG